MRVTGRSALILGAFLILSACGSNTEQRAATGGLGGVIAGAMLGGPIGAVAGGAAGGAAGTLVSVAVEHGAGAKLPGFMTGESKETTEQQKTKEEYKSTAEIKTLVQEPVPGVEGKQLTILHVSAPPEWVGGKHYHTGPVYVYILKGPFTVDEEGKGTRVFDTGQVYEEPIGQPMQAKNTNAAKPMEMLVVQISEEGEPLMYKAE